MIAPPPISDILSLLAPLLTALVALLGGLVGLRTYLDTRRKERLERSDAEFKAILENLFDSDARKRAVGAFALQSYLRGDEPGRQLQALSALQAAAHREKNEVGYNDELVSRGLAFAALQAAGNLSPDVLRQMSFRWVDLSRLDLTGAHLVGVDLRDAKLEDADLSGADLSGAKLNDASLRGAKLEGTILRRAVLTDTNLSGAKLTRADLAGAVVYPREVRDLDLDGADLSGANIDRTLRWEETINWRTALLDAALRQRLLDRYGPAPTGPQALMLMWEIPPLVAGGTWTASYHLVRSLRRLGANLVVVVPWDGDLIAAAAARPFDSEVDLTPLGIRPPSPVTPYAAPAWSPYGVAAWSPYGLGSAPPGYGSPYSWSAYAWSTYGAAFGPYPSAEQPELWQPTSLTLRLTEQFRQRLLAFCGDAEFDVIHAHDWVTFPAAEAAAEKTSRPWVAHFHSTVADRQSRGDPFADAIERRGAQQADRVIVPSEETRRKVVAASGIDEAKVEVVPNPLSEEDISLDQVGRFEARRVVFLGRLAEQKGPDLFVDLARAYAAGGMDASFEIIGDGELRTELERSAGGLVRVRSPLEWSARGEAFRDASAVVVPSRHEPFGMVVAEAMLRRVPVLYPRTSGIAEVIPPSIPIEPNDPVDAAAKLRELLSNLGGWERVVIEQARAIRRYRDGRPERRVQEVWSELAEGPGQREAGSK